MLRVRDLAVSYDDQLVIEGIDLDVETGKFASLVGPSGSGKTSILRVVTELVRPERGTVELDVPLTDVGFLFQDDALLPWRTVKENVGLGLRIRGHQSPEVDDRAEHWLELLGLKGYGGRYPSQLSGGQRKRVALAQILALRPQLLLMDEPFASLDAIVRTRITQELLDWVEREHFTVLLVTHDLEEAVSASDVVYVLGHGPGATIHARYDVEIPRPRNVLDTRRHPAFGPLLAKLWDDLSETRRGENPRP
jgi:NitT/TauT family transport system ATP-binding protein